MPLSRTCANSPEQAEGENNGGPTTHPQAYSVYVDETDAVWLTEWSANAIVCFDPKMEKFQSFPGRNVRQMLGRPGEVWAPESGDDRLVVVRYGEKTN